MLDIMWIEARQYQVIRVRFLLRRIRKALWIDCISGNYPQDRCEDLMHTLTISDISVELAKYEENIQEHRLGVGFSEVGNIRHAPLNILENFRS